METKKSYWTGKTSTELVDLNTEFLPAFHRPCEVVYVEAEYEQKLKDALLWQSRSMPRFYSFFVFGIIGFILDAVGQSLAGGLLVMCMGIGFIILPFSTPTTAKMFGLRKSFLVVRICAVLLILLGLFLYLDGTHA